MKKKIMIALGLMLLCTGCGTGELGDSVETDYSEYTSDWDMEQGISETYASDDVYATEAGDDVEDAVYEEQTAGETDENAGDISNENSDGNGAIKKEMLVYRGNISIDTLDFDTSVNTFKELLNEKGGFVESESYSDNNSTAGYYAIDTEYKHNLYIATVRVPSTEYDEIMNSATSLGDVRNRSSDVTNVTQQYSTYTSQLEIYEAEYNRYLSLLENATEDEYALLIENELFDIQIKMANLKSNISNIENDVSYSYIDITIKEVSEYEEEPVSTDTFLDRLQNTCKNSWNGFLEFVEEIVFFIIMNIYYIIIILIILFAVYRFAKKRKGAKQSRQAETPIEKTEDTKDTDEDN